jgi:hypothetical protein
MKQPKRKLKKLCPDKLKLFCLKDSKQLRGKKRDVAGAGPEDDHGRGGPGPDLEVTEGADLEVGGDLHHVIVTLTGRKLKSLDPARRRSQDPALGTDGVTVARRDREVEDDEVGEAGVAHTQSRSDQDLDQRRGMRRTRGSPRR